MPDLAADLDLLTAAVCEAGTLALSMPGPEAPMHEKPGGAGPVTQTDLAVNDLLRRRLRGARPRYGWLSEESPDDPSRLNAGRVFIVDPIDGTRSFIEGSRTWAHSVAIAERGEIVAGAVFLPARGKLYAARRGHGATLNGAPLSVSDRGALEGANVLATRPVMEPRHWPHGVPNVVRAHRPSLAYRLCIVAEGRFDAMLTLRDTWEWDIAAGVLVAAEAGATVTDCAGHPVRFNAPHPAVPGIAAGTPGVQAALLAGLAR